MTTSGRTTLAVALLAFASAAPAGMLPGIARAQAGALPLAPAAGLDRAAERGLRGNLLHDARRERAPGKSAAQAAREAREQYGGRVLSVTQEGQGRQAYYRVKLLENGNVRVVRIPAD